MLNKSLIVSLLLMLGLILLLDNMPTRMNLIDFWNGKVIYAYYSEKVVDGVVILITSFIYGWLTYSIIRNKEGKNSSLLETLKAVKIWLPRSLAALFIGWIGMYCISFLMGQVGNDFVFSFLAFLFYGLWITLTFTLYPTLIASQKPILKSLIEAFSINIKSANKWFHLLLLLFFISGGFTFLWVPEYWANRFWGMSEDYSGWMVHFQWLGGYSFQSFWYSDLTKWLFIDPPSIVALVVTFINILIATFVKIRVTGILFENGYLSKNPESEAETISYISTVEEKYLADKPFENINSNARVKETNFI